MLQLLPFLQCSVLTGHNCGCAMWPPQIRSFLDMQVCVMTQRAKQLRALMDRVQRRRAKMAAGKK